jgi:hypothetical protein
VGKKKENKKKKKWYKNPFGNVGEKAEKTLSDAERLLSDSHKVVKIGAVVFVTTMGLSMLSSIISIRLGLKAMKENKTKEEIILWNMMKKYSDKL